MKPYQTVAIAECQEPLVPLPAPPLALVQPHPYVSLGAPYGDKSPFYVRQGVLARLLTAQTKLQHSQPGYRIQVFDAYRPIAVQQFMVDYTFQDLAQQRGLVVADLTTTEQADLWQWVYQFWALPSADPATPPPHSTGAALDVTLVDAAGQPVDMGSPIDEASPRSYPDHFAQQPDPAAQQAHQQRQRLRQVMTAAGFCQHPNEWWHFSFGDQMWAWQTGAAAARYGRV